MYKSELVFLIICYVCKDIASCAIFGKLIRKYKTSVPLSFFLIPSLLFYLFSFLFRFCSLALCLNSAVCSS